MPHNDIINTLGLIVPRINQIMEPELVSWLGDHVRFEVGRIAPRGRPGGVLLAEDMEGYGQEALSLAMHFPAGLAAIAYGCTAGGFIAGAVEESRLVAAIAAATGKPCVSTAAEVVASLRNDGARRIAVVTPYSDSMNDYLERYMAAAGITIVRWAAIASPANDPETDGSTRILRLGQEAAGEDCDAVFIACSLVRTFGVVDRLQLALGRPVCSSISATAAGLSRVMTSPSTLGRPTA